MLSLKHSIVSFILYQEDFSPHKKYGLGCHLMPFLYRTYDFLFYMQFDMRKN